MAGKSAEKPVRDRPQIRLLRALAIAGETFREAHRDLFATWDLSLAEFDVVAALGNTQGMRMKDIASHLMTSASASNVTRLAIALEKRGLLKRRRSPESDREVIAQLTPKGQALFEEAFPKAIAFSTAFSNAALPLADQEAAVELLQRFIENAKARR